MDKLDKAKEEMRKTLKASAIRKAQAAEAEEKYSVRIAELRNAINDLAVGLKPVFEEMGRGLEVIIPDNDSNLIEVLYYAENESRLTRGVNTAALRIEFQPKTGTAKVLRRNSFFVPFAEVETVNIEDESSMDQLAEATIGFAKYLAAK